jgi:hypothetical protein
MLAAVRSHYRPTELGSDRSGCRDERYGCPDDRWPPAVRVLVFIGCAAFAWGIVIVLGSLFFG